MTRIEREKEGKEEKEEKYHKWMMEVYIRKKSNVGSSNTSKAARKLPA